MRQLAGADAYHVLDESRSQHMHTIKLLIIVAREAAAPVSFDTTRAWAIERFPRIPPLRSAVTLATDQVDPAARLAAVRESTRAARDASAHDRDLLGRWQDHFLLYRVVSRALMLAEPVTKRPTFNAIVSSVKGPRPLWVQDAPVVAVRSMGPLVGRQAINLTAWSYNDEFAIGLHACREHGAPSGDSHSS